MRGLSKLLLIFLTLSLATRAEARQPEDGSAETAAEGDEDPTGDAPADTDETEGDTEDPAEPATTAGQPGPGAQDDLASLRSEYFKLRDRLFQSKARASAVASALYSTRLTVDLNYSSARYYTVTRATIRLDGANIFDDSEGAIGADKAPRFEGYVAPGRHQVSIRIEATGKDDQRFTSVIDNSFVVQAVQGKDLEVKVTAKDDGNIAYKWKKKEQGSYQLHLDVSVKSKKRDDKKSDHVKRTGELRKHAPASTRRS